jgi:hypothetical protein
MTRSPVRNHSKTMKAADLLRELAYPFSNLSVALVIAAFSVLFSIAIMIMQVNPVMAVVGASLSLILLFAMFRYGMSVLDARANGRDPMAADIGIFSVFDGVWRVFPLVVLLPAGWLGVYLDSRFGGAAALTFGAAFLAVFPAFLAILAVTHSPVESINPAAIGRMIKACGSGYVAIPVSLLVILVTSNLLDARMPLLLDVILDTYTIVLMFTLTGAIAHHAGVAAKIDVGVPVARPEREVRSATVAEREKVASHAYGFISRGNREGGFRHIEDWIGRDPDPHDAVTWFFNEMMRWESKDAALFFAQSCFSHYLHHEQEAEALKLMSTCMHESPRWRPSSADLPHAIELAERYGRDDLLRSLRG